MSDAASTGHAELLAKIDLFVHLDRVTLAWLAAYLEPQTLDDGTIVCRQGDAADGLYIITRGTFGVFASSPDGPGETRLGTLSPPEAFGEMALLTDEPRSATVRAEGQGEVLRLERTRFHELLRREPAVALTIAATLSRRLRARDRTIVESDQAVAQIVEQGLGRLAPQRRQRVLEAGILDEMSMPALVALFGQDAEAVRRDLAEGADRDRVGHRARAAGRRRHRGRAGAARRGRHGKLRPAVVSGTRLELPDLLRRRPQHHPAHGLARARSNPGVVIITLLATASMWFLPAQTTSYLVAYSASEGRLYSHAQARRVGFAYVVVTLAGLALSVPYWRFIGLL